MFDLATLTSKAIREQDMRTETLTEQRNAAADRYRPDIDAMDMADIKAALTKDVERGAIKNPRLTGREKKAELVDAAVEAYADANEAGATLRRLAEEASGDREMASRLNGFIKAAERAKVKLTHEVDESGEPVRALEPHDMAYQIEWHGDDFQTAERLARYAHRVFRAVGSGHDIREVVMSEVQDAVKAVFRFPREVRSNGMAGNAKAPRMYEALAALEFIKEVAWAYSQSNGDDAQFVRQMYRAFN
ncbi:hypothetical protein [Actinomadura violacea]|uniref:Uncharacterized protein n=1 Tax=Actinomadura violacea TaxID=2819934 RepID=A0ABS3RYP7_9ACTN|nr:hypothetical protein [Actinomadura violacea]MBO2461583.1 hypothetical protein [Actinomadura violacea]